MIQINLRIILIVNSIARFVFFIMVKGKNSAKFSDKHAKTCEKAKKGV